MTTTLYLPQQPPRDAPSETNSLPALTADFASVPGWVPEALGCAPGLVDVLASGPGYVAYSVFDYEDGPVNEGAMRELSNITGMAFDVDDEDTVLLGPVLVVRW